MLNGTEKGSSNSMWPLHLGKPLRGQGGMNSHRILKHIHEVNGTCSLKTRKTEHSGSFLELYK